jgi:hypothetical protein
MRSQLICLPFYIEPDTAARAAHTWAALSNACHYHRYELAPTAAELTSWIDDVTELVKQLRNRAPSSLTPAGSLDVNFSICRPGRSS